MSDNEIEDVSFLPGESLHRKAVYEPSILQKIKISFCSRGKLAVFTLISCLLILILALLIALASDTCDNKPQSQTIQHEGKDKSQDLKQDYIATNGKPFPYTDIRLPHNIIPIHYNLFLHPNITQSYFKGKVEIDCEVKQSTNYVVFHLKDLNITNLEMRDGVTGTVYVIKEYMEYRTNEQIYVSLRERISSGTKVTIKVEFEGHLIRKLAGFYKSMYKTKAGVERYIATTHFEATDARTAFPCFDEPALKATFSLTMVREPAYKALFNMPLLKSTPYGQGLVQDMFQTSVKMSTYLVAFIVCDYEGIFNKTKRNITVGVYTPPDSISSAEFALQAAVKIIDYYEEFFGINYPLPKQDLVAIPDFAAGAMENWGLITYRMTSILYDPKIASAKNREWVTIVIAHELAHQWFGNLVTMKWWDDLWLNEGFASYVEYIGSAVVNEEWNMEELFLVSTQLKAEYLDCLKNSHPINLPVENPNQINELFDSIIYDKGASIIRMLSKFLGDDKFKAGLTAYLNRFHYSNAVTNDLWSSLSEAASQSNKGTDVKSIMQTWTEQAGYPVITMETRGNVVTLTQSRFLLYDSPNTTEPYKSKFGYVWEVPFSYRTSQDPNSIKKLLLKKKTGSFKVESKTTWIHGNPEMFGYYRVNYDKSGWEAIIKELNRYPKIFSSVERAGFIDDAFSLAQGGLLKYSTVFTLLEYMVHEEDYLPWQTLMDNIAYIQRRIENKPVHTNFVKYLLKLMKNQLDQTVWEDSGKPLEKYLRSVILSKAVYLGDTVSIEQGKKYFQDWKKDHNGINVNLKSTIFHTGVMYGEEKDWETVWTAYLNETIPSEKRRLLQALGYTRDARQLDRLLMYSLNESLIRSQDTHTLVSTVASKPAGQILAWRFFQRNWEIFSSRYSRAAFTMGGIIKSIGSSFDTEFDYNEFKNFFTTRDAGTGTMAVRQTLEKIQMNIDWSKKYEKEVTDWLKEHGN